MTQMHKIGLEFDKDRVTIRRHFAHCRLCDIPL